MKGNAKKYKKKQRKTKQRNEKQGKQNKEIKAGGLDVFEKERLKEKHAERKLGKRYGTQHTAAESLPEDIFPLFSDNYYRFIKGERLRNVLDFAKGY